MLNGILCPVRTQVRVPTVLIEIGDGNLGLILTSNPTDKIYSNSTSTDTECIEFLAYLGLRLVCPSGRCK